MELGLKDKVAIITGGSKGIGRAIALGLLAEGGFGFNCRARRRRPRRNRRCFAMPRTASGSRPSPPISPTPRAIKQCGGLLHRTLRPRRYPDQ